MPLVDYCASCRRHVNGALSCPGCGTYFLTDAPSAETAAPATALPEEPVPVAVAVGGRAARRRHLARLKKHKRRAATATVFALFGGGLTLAALPDGAAAKHANAATAPQAVDQAGTSTSAAGPRPAPTASAPTQQPSASASASVQAPVQTQSASRTRPAAAPSTQAVAPAGTQAGTRQVSVRPAAPSAPRTTTRTTTPTTAAAPTSAPTTATTQPSSGTSSPATGSTPPPTVCLLGLVCVN